MNKTELIASVAQKTELTKKDAEKAVKAVFDTVAQELAAGGKVQVIGSVLSKFVNAQLVKAVTHKTVKLSQLQLPNLLHSKLVKV